MALKVINGLKRAILGSSATSFSAFASWAVSTCGAVSSAVRNTSEGIIYSLAMASLFGDKYLFS